jgi:hypothetical protein
MSMPTEQWRKEHKEELRAYRRKWYHNNAVHAKKKIKERQKILLDWVQNFKSTLKCELCPENHIAVLDFHHKDPNEKDMEISKVHRWGWSIKRIQKEISKCRILCSNCHRKLHWDKKQQQVARIVVVLGSPKA